MFNRINAGIYVIWSSFNNRVYIGSTKNLNCRWTHHKHKLRDGTHHNVFLQRTFNKYGENIFEFGILERGIPTKKLIQRENWWIDVFKKSRFVLYNLKKAEFGNGGVERPEKWRKNLSEAEKKYHISHPNARFEKSRALKITCNKVSWRKRQSIALRKYFSTPEGKQSASDRTRNSWKDPVKRENRRHAIEVAKCTKVFKIASPTGELFSFCNIRQFALKHNLNYGSLANSLKLKQDKYRGWEIQNV